MLIIPKHTGTRCKKIGVGDGLRARWVIENGIE